MCVFYVCCSHETTLWTTSLSQFITTYRQRELLPVMDNVFPVKNQQEPLLIWNRNSAAPFFFLSLFFGARETFSTSRKSISPKSHSDHMHARLCNLDRGGKNRQEAETNPYKIKITLSLKYKRAHKKTLEPLQPWGSDNNTDRKANRRPINNIFW